MRSSRSRSNISSIWRRLLAQRGLHKISSATGARLMARLAGKIAFITGGGGGIGRATAERFAEEGAKVVVADIDTAAGEAAARSARTRAVCGGDGQFVRCDVTDRASVENAIAETVARYGKLDILHNNAGGSTLQDGPVTDAPEEDFWRVI